MFKFFRTQRFVLIFRIILLILTIFLFVFSLEYKNYHFIPLFFGIAIIFQIFRLVYFMEKTNRDLNNFLEAIRYSDFSRSFHVEGLGSSYNELKNTFNNVIKDFQKIRSEKEQGYHFLQNVMQHIGISLIAFDRADGRVELVNNAAKKLFKITHLKNISYLEKIDKKLVKLLLKMKTGEKKSIKIYEKDEISQLIIFAKEFRIRNNSILLVSIQNIQHELEEQEMIAWQKLIQVLTHEIMNSITPIISLSSTVSDMLSQDNIKKMYKQEKELFETYEDVNSAVNAINRRSDGLLHFVQAYRNLSRIPKPIFTIVPLKRLFDNIKVLFQPDISLRLNVEFVVSIEPKKLEITVDEKLIEQVLINLIKNSIQSIDKKISNNKKESKNRIEMKAFLTENGKVNIAVIDTGEGIIAEVIDKIFIPFFTTKNDGSGIGLSLSKQIIRKHGGLITVSSTVNETTCFNLIF